MKQFKAESKRLLDLMINSIYTNKEIFIRELISNASDALDKLYFLSLTNQEVGKNKEDFKIHISPDKENGTLTISDNGIGMTKKELEENLGIIAKSGSLDFKKENTSSENIDIIGQFGVGFYSSFMVASKIKVISRAFGEDTAWQWESKGAEGYTIAEAEKAEAGTTIILVIKADTEEEKYSRFLDSHTVSSLVKKHSDYIRYPIVMAMEKSRQKEGTEGENAEYEDYTESETVNSMMPIWKRPKNEVPDEEYAGFYQDKFGDYTAPARTILSKTEGTATYTALMFVPGRAPYDYYTKDFEKGLQLYASGVLIMDKCGDLLPDHFSFMKGLVDSQDLSLNISREMLQQDSQLRLMRTSLERKIRSELSAWLKNDRESYEEFFKNFGVQLKAGVYSSYGAEAENLKDLLLFYSMAEGKMQSLEEYTEKMPEGQKYIYYAAGDSTDRLEKLPQAELVREKGFDVLLLTDNVDEFSLQMLRAYNEKEFRNISGADLGLETEEEQEEANKQNEDNKDLFEFMQKELEGKVTAVKVSSRLKNHPVCITSEGGLSVEMEKVLNTMPSGEKVQSQKLLELNPQHKVFAQLQNLFETDKDRLAKYTDILYNQALLIEGLPIQDPVAYAEAVCDLMAE